MCGIAGYKAFGKARPTREEITRLLLGIEPRGTDATGIAYIMEKKQVQVIKSPNKASEFIKTEIPDDAEYSRCMIMHTRAATQGSSKNNNNNHPIYSKEGIVIVHNGIIRNDDILFAKHAFRRDGVVDSEIILHLVKDGWWESIKRLNELRGSCACAMINSNRPGDLILVRSGNPLSTLIDKERDIMFFASTRYALEKAVTPVYFRGFSTQMVEEVEDDVALLINSNGVVDIEEVEVEYTYSYKSYKGTVYSTYPGSCADYSAFKDKKNKKNKGNKNNGDNGSITGGNKTVN